MFKSVAKMKFFNWLKRRTMPRSKARVQELFEVVGFEDTPEWKAIEDYFNSNEVPPQELIYAAFKTFLACKDQYASALTQQAYEIREDIVLTQEAMMPEGEHE